MQRKYYYINKIMLFVALSNFILLFYLLVKTIMGQSCIDKDFEFYFVIATVFVVEVIIIFLPSYKIEITEELLKVKYVVFSLGSFKYNQIIHIDLVFFGAAFTLTYLRANNEIHTVLIFRPNNLYEVFYEIYRRNNNCGLERKLLKKTLKYYKDES